MMNRTFLFVVVRVGEVLGPPAGPLFRLPKPGLSDILSALVCSGEWRCAAGVSRDIGGSSGCWR